MRPEHWLYTIPLRLRSLFRWAQADQELDDELRDHLERKTEEYVAQGMAPEEARRLARLELGGVEKVKEECRDARGINFVSNFSQDLRLGFRNVHNKPLFSLMVVLMVALGVAGNAAIFSIYNSLSLRALPFAESDRLVDLDETAPKWNLKFVGISANDYFAWSKGNGAFDSMAVFRGPSYNLSAGGIAERVTGAQVSRGMLDVLRLKPLLGRNFSPQEDSPGGPKVVVLSYGLWRRMFDGDRNVLGRVVKLDEKVYTVIGVLPREAVFPDRVELWTPLAADPTVPSGYYLSGIGRLKPGILIEQARADLLRVHRAMVSEGHRENEITSPVLTPLRDRYVGDLKTVSKMLLGAVGLVLLTACVNIAALMLVRSSLRSRELAIRAALGASRARIVAQLVTESVVLAGIGGALGIILGAACTRAIVSLMPDQIPQWITFSLDGSFAIFCVAISGAAALLFELAPALQASRSDICRPLQNAAARATEPRGQRATLNAFVVCEIGLALMLSISAGLLVQSFRKVLHVDPGFRPENVLTFHVSVPDATYDTHEKKIAYYDKLFERLRSLPGVSAAGATSAPPFGGQWGGQFEAEGGRVTAHGENPVCLRVAATPGYVEAIGMTLLDGRTFTEDDGAANSPLVVLVNETFAKYFWRDENPVGKRIRYPGAKDWFQVIGFLRDEKHYGLDQPMKPGVFLPYSEAVRISDWRDARAFQQMSVVLRASLDPATLVGPAREILRELDPEVPMYHVHTMTEEVDRSLWARRAYSWLLGVFAVIALLLTAAGMYGTLSYRVSQRTQEIGIRMALGARPEQVLGQVLRGGMTLVSVGVAIGLIGAFWATSLLRNLLFGVNARDPLIYGAVVLGAIAVALLANLVPARRAAKVDPIVALRYE